MSIKLTSTNFNEELFIPVWRDRNFSVFERFMHPDVEVHTTFVKGVGIEVAEQSLADLFATFPVFDLNVEEIIETPGRITYKWSAGALQNKKILGFNIVPGPLSFNGIVFLVLNEENLIVKYHSFSNITQVLTGYQGGITTVSQEDSILESFVVELTDIIFLLAKSTSIHLTRREVECLYFWVKGYSIKETARNLGGISGKTVQTFRESIRKKFDVNFYHEILEILHRHNILTKILDQSYHKRFQKRASQKG